MIAYIGRSGTTTYNILVVCDFNIYFTFIMVGWKESAHDSHILKFAMRNREYKLIYPPKG